MSNEVRKRRLKFKQFMKEFEVMHGKCWEALPGRFRCNATLKSLEPQAHMCFCNAMKDPKNYVRFMCCFETLLTEAIKRGENKEAVNELEKKEVEKKVDCALCSSLGRACPDHERSVIERQVDLEMNGPIDIIDNDIGIACLGYKDKWKMDLSIGNKPVTVECDVPITSLKRDNMCNCNLCGDGDSTVKIEYNDDM